MELLLFPESRFRKGNPFANMSLRAPEGCVAISLKKARLLRFTRRDSFLNQDLGFLFFLDTEGKVNLK